MIIREIPIGNQSISWYWSRVRFRFRSDVFFPLLLLLLPNFLSTPPEVVVNIADLFPHTATNVVTAGSLPPALYYLSSFYIYYLHHHYTPNLTWTSIWKSKFTPTLPTSPLLLWFYAFPPLFVFSPPRLTHMIQGTFLLPPGPPRLHQYHHLWQRMRRTSPVGRGDNHGQRRKMKHSCIQPHLPWNLSPQTWMVLPASNISSNLLP